MTENEERLARWKEMTAHVIAIILTIGFFGIAFMALVGIVQIQDATTATFVGTVTGYAIGQLSRPLAYYFAVPRQDHLEKNDNRTHTTGNKSV